jgi:hypothetical protein
LVTFGDASKHPVGQREKVLLKVLTCLKNEVLVEASWSTFLGETYLGYDRGLVYRRVEGGRAGRELERVDEAMMMRRMAFARKLEDKAMALLFGAGRNKNDGVRLAEVSSEKVRQILNRRRIATLGALRDAMFGLGAQMDGKRIAENSAVHAFNRGDLLWNERSGNGSTAASDPPLPPEEHDACSQVSVLGPSSGSIFEELSTVDEPLGCAETRLLVMEPLQSAVAILVDALKENSHLLTDGQYAHFLELLAGDVSTLVAVLIEFQRCSGNYQADYVYQATIQYSSCMYLARCMCMMRFGGSQSERKTLVNALPVLDESCAKITTIGQTAMDQMLSCFREDCLRDHIEPLTTWRQSVDIQDIISKKKSVSRLIHAFRQLRKSLEPVPDAMFTLVSGSLLDWVAEIINGSILALRDISEELSEVFPQVLEDLPDGLLDAICEVKPHQTEGEDTSTGPSKGYRPCTETDEPEETEETEEMEEMAAATGRDSEGVRQTLVQRCVGLSKLKSLCRIMSMTSLEIVTEWEQGTLGNLFDKDEVVLLIKALFEDTPQVQMNLLKLL